MLKKIELLCAVIAWTAWAIYSFFWSLKEILEKYHSLKDGERED